MANLSDLARPATEAPIGTGIARLASNTIQMKKLYDKYVIQAQENGETPLPFKEWAASNINS